MAKKKRNIKPKWLCQKGPDRWLEDSKVKEWNEASESLSAELAACNWRAILDRWVCVGIMLMLKAPDALENFQALLHEYDGCDMADVPMIVCEFAFLVALGECLDLEGPAVQSDLETASGVMMLVNAWWLLEDLARNKAGQDEVAVADRYSHPSSSQLIEAAYRAFKVIQDRACLQRVVGADSVDHAPKPDRVM
jgi:hypothetical protein